jgi:hypothetical protein
MIFYRVLPHRILLFIKYFSNSEEDFLPPVCTSQLLIAFSSNRSL